MSRDLIKKFPCKDVLTREDDFKSMRYIDNLIENSLVIPTTPGHQTSTNLLAEDLNFWKKYYDSLINSVHQYVNKKIKIIETVSWGHLVSDDKLNDIRDQLWHDHIYDPTSPIDMQLPNMLRENQHIVCCVYYLNIPEHDDLETAGTEFVIDGDQFYVIPEHNCWYLFGPTLLHRHGITKGNRYIISADVIYEIEEN